MPSKINIVLIKLHNFFLLLMLTSYSFAFLSDHSFILTVSNHLLLGAGDSERGIGRGSYHRDRGQQGSGDPYRGRDPYPSYDTEDNRNANAPDSYGRGSVDPRGHRTDESYGRGSEEVYGRGGGDPRGGGHSGGSYSGYDAGDNENYPSNYQAVPMPGAPRNCTGSGCCVPKCFAEKGTRVSS